MNLKTRHDIRKYSVSKEYIYDPNSRINFKYGTCIMGILYEGLELLTIKESWTRFTSISQLIMFGVIS